MPVKSPVAKIALRGRKKKQQIAVQSVKKVGNVDIKTTKAKVQARVKAVKKRGRR